MKTIKQILTALALMALLSTTVAAQDQKGDPTSESDMIKETLAMIKEVEKLNYYLQQIQTLTTENKSLKGQIATLTKQVAGLTKEVQTSNERLRKQLLSLPPFEIRSKVIGTKSAMAVLKLGERIIRIRNDMEMNVPVENGIWTLMKVEKISKDIVVLNFTELDRVITIYD